MTHDRRPLQFTVGGQVLEDCLISVWWNIISLPVDPEWISAKQEVYKTYRWQYEIQVANHTTVDGRNPAPVDMVNLLLFTRVLYIPGGWEWDFFHQQYCYNSARTNGHHGHPPEAETVQSRETASGGTKKGGEISMVACWPRKLGKICTLYRYCIYIDIYIYNIHIYIFTFLFILILTTCFKWVETTYLTCKILFSKK